MQEAWALWNLHAIAFANEAGRSLQNEAGRMLLGAEPTHSAF